MLREVVGSVFSTRAQLASEVALSYSILYPIVPHVNRFRSSLLHGIIRNSFCAFVIGGDGCWRLGMVEIGECLA